MNRSIIFISIFVSMIFSNVHAHDNGFVLNLKANFSGTQTLPSISDADLALMGASYMKGMMGFIMDGEAEFGYIFGSEEYFNMNNNDIFSGMGAFITLGVGQGYAGQISGSVVGDETINVFFNAFYTPVVSFTLGTKAYFFKNRMAVGLNVGGKMIADMSPTYEFYSDEPPASGDSSPVFPPEVGTIIVTDDMMKKMNPLMLTLKASIDYYQPIVERMELILGAYAAYNFYAPGYITMPSKLAVAAVGQGFDPATTPLKSFRIDSLDFGLTLGISFKA